MAIVEPTAATGASTGSWAGALVPPAGRLGLDGKYFVRRGRRVRIQGVTYGPFAPNTAGEPFPDEERLREDLARMGDVGVNALRTYHVPPS
jgi:hypothetical protein